MTTARIITVAKTPLGQRTKSERKKQIKCIKEIQN